MLPKILSWPDNCYLLTYKNWSFPINKWTVSDCSRQNWYAFVSSGTFWFAAFVAPKEANRYDDKIMANCLKIIDTIISHKLRIIIAVNKCPNTIDSTHIKYTLNLFEQLKSIYLLYSHIYNKFITAKSLYKQSMNSTKFVVQSPHKMLFWFEVGLLIL